MTRIFRIIVSGLAVFWSAGIFSAALTGQAGPVEAPTGFDNLTNGHLSQGAFDAARATFEERDEIPKGLGPVYNAQSCAECHQSPLPGGISQIVELRAGHFNGVAFVPQIGGSLINDRATNAEIQERVLGSSEVRTFRTSLNVLGDGFVEAIADDTLIAIADRQPVGMRGEVIHVPFLEANGLSGVGRFGWKNQHASLLSFASDAYLNEIGITNRFNLVENTSMGRFVGFGSGFDPVPDDLPCRTIPNAICGEDQDDDITAFAEFMRSTKAPPRGPLTPQAGSGSAIFDAIGCNVCHVRNIVTAPPGTIINGGTLQVSAALGNKIIHPFGDFLLHDIGTGDGIVQNGGPSTRQKMRTAPLWGMRTRDRLMHDGLSLTRTDAILRHGGQATGVRLRFIFELTETQRSQLIAFLNSL